ncbi:MAG: hypothetical protein CSB44_00940 [Gammaproteobacteria bacterium]|nr:MAG: hypothetical protein CSB44_00940 [Gammaproteobacteria bacterium]
MTSLIIAQHELTRLFGTRRGWLTLAALVLLWALIMLYVLHPASRFLSDADTNDTALLVGALLERFGWDHERWVTPELALYWVIALQLFPGFALLMAADQTASDKARGTLRFLLLRASRLDIFFSRFAGQVLIQLLVVLATLSSVLVMVVRYSPERQSEALELVPIIIGNLVLVLLPMIALMSLLSVLVKSPRRAILLSVVVWVVGALLLTVLRSRVGPLPILDWVLPGSQINELLRLAGRDTFQLAAVPLVHTVVLLAAGAFAMWKVDL